MLYLLLFIKFIHQLLKETPNAKSWAENELATMGKIALAEKFMIGNFVIALTLWIVGSFIHIDATRNFSITVLNH
ncbi:anion permease [Staphylococcus aureus]